MESIRDNEVVVALFSTTNELRLDTYNGTDWVEACAPDGTVLPGGDGAIVPNSRGTNDPGTDQPNISIQMYHFTGIQPTVSASQAPTEEPNPPPASADDGGGGGGCC